jgi:NAD(P)-dependent dehydrogenase (short-subunit alcohol dehydrogenase family)
MRTAAALGSLDILINNSGIAPTAAAIDLDEAEWDRCLDTNLKGAWLMAQAAAHKMIEGGKGGVIVNTASILSIRVQKGTAPYAISKAGLLQMTKALALEWARYGIRVNAIAPGYIETDINRDFLKSELGQQMMKSIPQRRFGQAEDLDGALLFLTSDASQYVTGVFLPVDGGHSLALA